MTDNTTPAADAAARIEPKPIFRADTDQSGDWYVWRRLGTNGWATMRRCSSRDDAERLAADMNTDPQAVLFGI